MITKPTWQTEELQEEWIDQDEEGDSLSKDSFNAPTTSELSFTQTLGSVLVRSHELGSSSSSRQTAGTVIVREDLPAAPLPLLPQTPGAKKGLGKDFFSPLALEKMFEPPSPPTAAPVTAPSGAPHVPTVRSRLSQVYVPGGGDDTRTHEDSEEADEWDATEDAGALATPAAAPPDCQFTFEVPRPGFFNPMNAAQSTPGPSHAGPSGLHAPATDPRLRLFQFQYDTFTREHLSAMVDSIAINTPSGGSGQVADDSPSAFSHMRDASLSRLRSVKRIKLSPASDFSEQGDGAAVIMRPTLRRDYVGESKSLMEKIRSARDFSTVSTAASARTPGTHEKSSPGFDMSNIQAARIPALFAVPDDDANKARSANGTTSSRSAYSSLAYREQAANLMAQIRKDMKGSRRIFSGDTEASHLIAGDEKADASFAQSLSVTSDSRPLDLRGREDADTLHVPKGAAGRSSLRGVRTSPRERPRTTSAMPDVDRQLATDVANISLDVDDMLSQFPPPPVTVTTVPTAPNSPAAAPPGDNRGLLAPPSDDGPTYPSSSVRRKEDLTRFVSSSTASGTTLTVGSGGSYARPSGPRRITPGDIPSLPERVGKMVFDKVMMRWVKDTAQATAEVGEQTQARSAADGDPESEDPFRDIESLREDDGHSDTERGSLDLEKSRIEAFEAEDEEEAELTSFSFDGASADVLALDAAENPDSDSEEDEATASAAWEDALSDASGDELPVSAAAAAPRHRRSETAPAVTPPLSTPDPPRTGGLAPGPTPLPAAKSHSATPVSALKSASRERTPANTLAHRRSVSFSDGKRDGPIAGIGRNAPTPDGVVDGISPLANATKHSAGTVPSARTRRIAETLRALEDPLSSDSSPSKASSSGRARPDELQPLRPRRPSAPAPSRDNARRVSRAHTLRSPRAASRSTAANATFLTECSFGVAHDRLVQVLTDVQPFEPHWEGLAAVDVSHRGLESLARLKEFLPRLDALAANGNQLSWLSGVPGTVRSLSVACNALTGVTSFGHLANLESLDISRNQVDSLRQLECLRHLRELRADGNRIASIEGLERLDGLVKLSLENNVIRSIALQECRWTRLEMLNVSHNRLAEVGGLASLAGLIALNLDHNVLSQLDAGGAMPKLRILRASGNRLAQLDAQHWPNLRTLYADNNLLGTIAKAHRLGKLENLSLRSQGGRPGLSLSLRDVRDVKRLYLSGNPLDAAFLPEPCYNLVYLEAAACRLSALPDLARLVPNLRALNLNYNFLDDPRPLAGLVRLRKLSLVGSRIPHTRQLVRALHGMADVEMIDFRMNPCTLGWYLPLLVKDVPGALQPSDERARDRGRSAHSPRKRARTGSPVPSDEDAAPTWKELDAKFRRDLPDAAYVGRLAYRGLVMRACPRVKMLDGVEVSTKEREKAERLLVGVGQARQQAQTQTRALAAPQGAAR